MMFHYLLTGDDRLARHTIETFASSLQPDGLLCGSYPSTERQILPGFSLFWIMAVCDHMLYFDDSTFTRRQLPTIDAILEHFNRLVDSQTGLVGRFAAKYWSYIDWNEDWPAGYPSTESDTQPLSFFSMIYAFTLRRAASLLTQVGRTGLVAEYQARAASVSNAVFRHCYDGQYFTDIPTAGRSAKPNRRYSQVAQVWGILCAAIDQGPKERTRRILASAFGQTPSVKGSSAPRFSVCSYPMQHYAFRALALQDDLYDAIYHSRWDPWRKMLDKHLTTWEEDDINSRSDCHQWSSLPIYEFLAEVAGLTPLEPGWKVVRFSPRLKLQKRLYARVEMGRTGCAEIEWRPNEPEGELPRASEGQGGSVVTLRLPKPLKVMSQRSNGEISDCGVLSHLSYVDTS